MEEPCAVVTYLISSLRKQVQGLLLALQVSNNFKDGESTQSQYQWCLVFQSQENCPNLSNNQ